MAISADLLENIDCLAPLPMTAQRLIGLLEDESSSADRIAEVIEFDQALASNILRLSNSAFYASRFQIERKTHESSSTQERETQ